MFWSQEKRLQLFCDSGDELKFCRDANILFEVQRINIDLPWDIKLSRKLATSLQQDNIYNNFGLVKDLLRAIRNKAAHHGDPQSRHLKVFSLK
jgi:hypothetical protein